MNRQDLINYVAVEAEISKAAAGRAVATVLSGVQAGLQADGEVQLVGFGTFSIKERAARPGRNPQTGAVITIAASRKASFKAGKALNEAVS